VADVAKPKRTVRRILRSAKRRALLLLDAGHQCPRCGAELTDEDFEADHIEPWSKTHRTNVHEMQALCGRCNRIKGAQGNA
jgi:5-methylcytosine-specific restriction endonuclease McrA